MIIHYISDWKLNYQYKGDTFIKTDKITGEEDFVLTDASSPFFSSVKEHDYILGVILHNRETNIKADCIFSELPYRCGTPIGYSHHITKKIGGKTGTLFIAGATNFLIGCNTIKNIPDCFVYLHNNPKLNKQDKLALSKLNCITGSAASFFYDAINKCSRAFITDYNPISVNLISYCLISGIPVYCPTVYPYTSLLHKCLRYDKSNFTELRNKITKRVYNRKNIMKSKIFQYCNPVENSRKIHNALYWAYLVKTGQARKIGCKLSD